MADENVDILVKAREITQAAFAQVQAQLKELETGVGRTNATLSKTDGTLNQIYGGLKSAAGLMGVTFGATAIIGFARSVFDTASEIKDMAGNLDISTDAAQEFKFAAEQTGTSMGAVSAAIAFMNRSLSEGNKSTVGALKAAGLEFANIRNMKPEDAFKAIATAIKAVEDPMLQQELATKLLGKSSKELLAGIREDFVAVGEGASKMSADTIDRLERAQDAWAELAGKVTIYSAEIIGSTLGAASQVTSSWGAAVKFLEDSFKFGTGVAVTMASATAQATEELKKQKETHETLQPALRKTKDELDEEGKAQKAAATAAEAHTKAIKAQADTFTTAAFDTKFNDLAEAFNVAAASGELTIAGVKRMVAEYEKLRQEIGPGALPGEIERLDRVTMDYYDSLSKLTGGLGKVPGVAIGVERAFNDIEMSVIRIGPKLDAFGYMVGRDLGKEANVGTLSIQQLIATMQKVPNEVAPARQATVDWTGSLGELTGALDVLASSGGPMSGVAGHVAEFTNILAQSVGRWKQLGADARTAFQGTVLDSDGNEVAASASERVSAIVKVGAAVVATIGQINAAVARNRASGAPQGLSVLEGALAGAMTGGALGGGIGAIIGGIGGAAYAAWQSSKSSVSNVVKQIGVDMASMLDFSVSSGLASKISDDIGRFAAAAEKAFDGAGKRIAGRVETISRRAAEVWNLDQLIAEAGGLNDLNFDGFIAQFNTAISLMQDGVLTAGEVDDVFRRAFPAMAQYIAGSGELATREWERFIERAGELTEKIDEVTNFVLERSGSLAGAVGGMLEPLSKEYGSIVEEIGGAQEKVGQAQERLASGLGENVDRARASFREAQAEFVAAQSALNAYDAGGGSDPKERARLLDEQTAAMERYEAAQRSARQAEEEYATAEKGLSAAQQELNELLEKQGEGARNAGDDLQRMGVLAMAAFNQSRQQGASFLESMRAIGPALSEIRNIQENLPGLEQQNNAALNYLLYYNQLIETAPELVNAAENINVATVALSQMGALGAEELAALGGQAVDTYNQMLEKGFQSNESLSMMQDFLRNARQRYEELGIPIDENTQRLLEMAEAAGIDTEPVETMAQTMGDLKEGLKDVVDTLKEGIGGLIELLGGDLPDKWKEVEQATKDAARDGVPEIGKLEDAASDASAGVDDITTKAGELDETLGEADYTSAFDDGREAARRFRDEIDDLNRTIGAGASGPGYGGSPTRASDYTSPGSPFSQAAARAARASVPIQVRIPVMLNRRQIAEAVYEDLPSLLQARGALT